eukprot:scaffold6710_cov66-Phaeocystis_antarctica.AAC.3
MATSSLMDNNATEGESLYLGTGSTTTYVLPAPPGYWMTATKCEVWREACLCSSPPDAACTACRAAAENCKMNPTDNLNNYNVTSSLCTPITFNQPCDWQNSPALLGKTVYVLPLGSHDLNYPFACAAGVLGGNGSLTSQQTSAACAGLCPAGFTCGAEATVAPTACPKGHYCPKGTSVALPCLPGSYSDATSLTSAGECTDTNAGHFAPTGSTRQTACSPGTVQPDSGKGTCDKCVAGTYQKGEGKQACVACKPGSFCPEGASAALPCKEGSYSDATNLTTDAECTPTANGHYAPTGSTMQTACSPGTVAPNASMGACDRCAAGSFQGKEGNQTCKPCPKSSWCAAGSSAPTACEAGKVGRRERLMNDSECEDCPMGYWCSAGLEVACGVNTFQPLINQIYAGACQQCPRSAESGESSASIEDCKCQKDYYDSDPADGNVSCEPCPIGSECKESGSTLALLPLLPGYWRTNDTSSDLRRCPDASSPNTTSCANANGVLCKPWTAGTYCRVCNVSDGSRYFDSGQSACVQCGVTAVTSLAALTGITLAVLFLLCWCGWRQPCKSLRKLAYQALQKLRAPLKQMVAFYQAQKLLLRARHFHPADRSPACTAQIVARVESVFKVAMPASVASLLNVVDVLNLSIDVLGLPLSCLQLDSFFSQLLFLVLSPCVLGILVLACSMATEVLAKCKAASLKVGLIRALPYLLYVLFFAFPLVSSRAFQAFDCEEFDDGTSFLRVDYSLNCNDAEYGR